MALPSNLYAFKVQTLENILAQTAAPNVPEWPSYGNFRQVTQTRIFLKGHPKAAFSEKVQTGEQGKFLKNRPKSGPRLKGPKALWRKRHYPLISIHLKWNDRKRLRRKQRLQKCKNGQVIGIFVRSPKTLIF